MTDIVQQADDVMNTLMHPKSTGRYQPKTLTKSQIRKFLTAVNTVTNKVNMYKIKHPGETEMDDDLTAEVKYLKVKIVYQAGREAAVKQFVNTSRILDRINSVGNSIKEYNELAKYVEALVAYHKFYGGKD